MPKCTGCGKFMSSPDCARCYKCTGSYHRSCVGMQPTADVPRKWICPGCNEKTSEKGLLGTQSSEKLQEPNEDINLALEIRSFRLEINAMRTELREFRQEMSEFKLSINNCHERVNEMEVRVVALEKQLREDLTPNQHLEATVADLKMQLNERDQDLLLNDIVLSGVPETIGENVNSLLNILSLKLGVQLDERDVVDVARVGSVRRNRTDNTENIAPPRPRNIAVRFARRVTRDQVISAARVRRGLNTTDIGLQGQPRRIYVNERLTPLNGKLFHSAREAGKGCNYKYIWTKGGKIFIKQEDGAITKRVRSDIDISEIFGFRAV